MEDDSHLTSDVAYCADQPCESCDQHIKTFYCVSCISDYCDACWPKQGPHKSGKRGVDGLPHEKTDRRVLQRLHHILSPPSTTEEQNELHRVDLDTTWFGIDQEDNYRVFKNYGRYNSIMAATLTKDVRIRYPQLVSFIGQTGAGKSTLIKMLIDHQEAHRGLPLFTFPSPVVGSVNNNIPTSADVHLYEDPGTAGTQQPFLFADCEGLEGGEIDPLALKYRRTDDYGRPRTDKKGETARKIRKAAHSSRLEWAINPEKSSRQYAVRELYPRLLYTFSDVIVFVLRNSKTFEVVLEKMLLWAMASIEKSLNQPLLPHAIIALNATDNSIKKEQWFPEEATKTLLRDIDSAIRLVPAFAKYAAYWRIRGRKIVTMKDLLNCFYGSITVVRIPTKGRYMLINEQVGRLHTEIRRACIQAHDTRQAKRMLCNADDLGTYLQIAFDHFSRDLDSPFNFTEMSLRNNPIPLDFRGNILKLALAIKDSMDDKNLTGRDIFEPLSSMVASCIMLDFTRQKYQGEPLELLEKHYMDPCVKALRDFCNLYWPCSFVNKAGQCFNNKLGHSPKGHQNHLGRILAVGPYQSDFLAGSYEDTWKRLLRGALDEYIKDLRSEAYIRTNSTEEGIAHGLHLKNMNQFYVNLGSATEFISHSACFSCLRELPSHPLPCGHVLCTKCVIDYGMVAEKYWIYMHRCPLHTRKPRWAEPFVVKLKPAHAGVRILTLDGGGVRGIIELEVLKKIEAVLGGNIRIQSFFDLIVGTSTGGIISLGLGVENWSVKECIGTFRKLVGRAFSPRDFHGLPGFQSLAFMHHHSMYRTRPFEAALKESSNDPHLFGGIQTMGRYQTKTAVLSASGTGQYAVVMANYNRPDFEEQDYHFERAERPSEEIKTWEAARATSAAPRYFKSFQCERTCKQYWDGALYHNNPVVVANHERKLLWPDTKDSHPDLILSIGTGFKANAPPIPRPSLRVPNPTSSTSQEDIRRSNTRRKTRWQSLFSALVNRVHDILDSERIWATFMMDTEVNTKTKSRYQRINVDLGYDPPALDDVKVVERIQTDAATRLDIVQSYKLQIFEISRQLIASSFFFEKDSLPLFEGDNGYLVTGKICCRFRAGSEEMRPLGEYLRRQQRTGFQPFFSATSISDDRESPRQHFTIEESIIHNMRERAIFNLGSVSFPVTDQTAETIIMLHLCEQQGKIISGFPRFLFTEDAVEAARHQSRAASTSSDVSHRRSSSSTPTVASTSSPELCSQPSTLSMRKTFGMMNLSMHTSNKSPSPSPSSTRIDVDITKRQQRNPVPVPITPVLLSPARSESCLPLPLLQPQPYPEEENGQMQPRFDTRMGIGPKDREVSSHEGLDEGPGVSGAASSIVDDGMAARESVSVSPRVEEADDAAAINARYARDLAEATKRSLYDQ